MASRWEFCKRLDSLAAIPLSLISAERVTNLYDLMDAAYCSNDLREHSQSLGRVHSSQT